jgi:hypothetical protein
MLDEHARGDLVVAKDNAIAGQTKAPRTPKSLFIREGMATMGTIV